VATEEQYISGRSGVDRTAWTETGTTPFLSSGDASYVSTATKKAEHGDFSFADFTEAAATITAVNMYVRCLGDALKTMQVFVSEDGGTTWDSGGSPYTITPPSSAGEQTIDVSSTLTTWTHMDNAEIYIKNSNQDTQTLTVYHARLVVTFSTGEQKNVAGGVQLVPSTLAKVRRVPRALTAGVQFVPASLTQIRRMPKNAAGIIQLVPSALQRSRPLAAEFVETADVEWIDTVDVEFLERITIDGVPAQSVAGGIQLTPATTAKILRAKRTVAGAI
jgi:hypothetical protein